VTAAARWKLRQNRAAERWLDGVEHDNATDDINRAISGLQTGHAFTDAAAAALVANDLP